MLSSIVGIQIILMWNFYVCVAVAVAVAVLLDSINTAAIWHQLPTLGSNEYEEEG